MYSIGNVIVGYTIPYDLRREAEEKDFTEIVEGYEGVHTLYSGSGDFMPMYIGVSICTIDECKEVDLDDLMMKFGSTVVHILKAQGYVAKLIQGLKDEGEAENFKDIIHYLETTPTKKLIVWSTS